MGQLASYFRQHKWQRRLLTTSLIILAAIGTAIFAYPVAIDRLIIHNLGSDDSGVRTNAIVRAIARATKNPATLRRIADSLDTRNEKRFRSVLTVLRYFLLRDPNRPPALERLAEALETDDESRFQAVAATLRDAARFDVPDRKGIHIDRMRAIDIVGSLDEKNPTRGAYARAVFTSEAVLCGRDNKYVRRALAAATSDPSSKVRRLAALLAARLDAREALGKLLDDDDPPVVATAAMGAGLAGRKSHLAALKRLLRFDLPGDAKGRIGVQSAAALAIALLDGQGSAEMLASMTTSTNDARLRDRLLHVLTLLDAPAAKAGVLAIFDEARKANTQPPTAALIAAGKLRIVQAGDDIRGVLSAALRRPDQIYDSQLLAAIQSADALKLPVRREIFDICRKYWDPRNELLLAAAARVLGRQAKLDQPLRHDAPSRRECIGALQMAAVWETPPATRPTATSPASFRTPLASSAAAIALWELGAKGAENFVRDAAGAWTTLPGDYVAWHLSRLDRAEAYKLGLRLLPPLGAPPEQRVYNKNERATGAMLLALSAGANQSVEARRRVRSRLEGGDMGGEKDFYLAGAYRCALLMLGDAGQDRMIFELLEVGAFPQRRAVTALCAAGDKRALDWILWNPGIDEKDIIELLTGRGIGEVLETLAPQLPRVDTAAEDDLAQWQVRILRNYYAIHRSKISPGLQR